MLTRRDWEPEAVLRLFLHVLAAFAAAGLVAALASGGGQAALPPGDRWRPVVIGQAVFQSATLVASAWFLRFHGRTWRTGFGLDAGPPARAAGIGLLAGLAFLPAAYGLQWLVVETLARAGHVVTPQRAVAVLLDAGPAGRCAMFASAAVVAPVVEEILFRAVLYTTIRDTGRPRTALIVTGVVFGALHANAAAFLPLALFGVLLALLYERTGSLLAPVAAHAAFNLAPFVVLAREA